jgi:hypothetical protein
MNKLSHLLKLRKINHKNLSKSLRLKRKPKLKMSLILMRLRNFLRLMILRNYMLDRCRNLLILRMYMISIYKELVVRLLPDSHLNLMVIFILDIVKLLDLTLNWPLIIMDILILDMMILILLKRTKNILIRFLRMFSGWVISQPTFSLPLIILINFMNMLLL